MKKSLFVLFLLGLIHQGRAQKIIEKHLDFPAGGYVSMNFQVSDSIRIITWNKNEVYIRSSINVNENQDNDAYHMTFDESGKEVTIRGKLQMSGGQGCRTSESRDSSEKRRNNYNCCCCCQSEIIHEVYVPEDADFSVETINGDIVITGKTGAVRAHSISGFIDLSLAPERAGSVELHTITGTMYSNYDLPVEGQRPRHVGGGSVSAELNGGKGKRIELETISGDIFFRKA